MIETTDKELIQNVMFMSLNEIMDRFHRSTNTEEDEILDRERQRAAQELLLAVMRRWPIDLSIQALTMQLASQGSSALSKAPIQTGVEHTIKTRN